MCKDNGGETGLRCLKGKDDRVGVGDFLGKCSGFRESSLFSGFDCKAILSDPSIFNNNYYNHSS